MTLRHARRASLVALGAMLVAGLPAATAHADEAGPPAPGWHYLDDAADAGPPVSTVDLRGVGDVLPEAQGDEGTATITAPFPVAVNDVTSTTVRISTNGYLGVTDGQEVGTVRAMAGDQVTSSTLVQTLGEAPDRQLVIHQYGVTGYRDATIGGEYSYTFFEGRSGVLVTYPQVVGTGDRTVGLSEGFDHTSPLTLAYTGTVESGRSIWYTDEAAIPLPPIAPVTSDPFGYRVITGQPAGDPGDLAATGRLVAEGDTGHATLALPFAFDYYGRAYSQLTVTTDATFGFGAGNVPSSWTLPNANDASGLLWAHDLSTRVYTQVRGTAPHRQYLVQWVGQRYFDGSAAGRVRITMVLFEGGDNLGVLYADVPESGTGVVGLNRDATRRYELRTPVVDGDALLWSTSPDASGSVIEPPEGGSPVDPFGYRALTSGTPVGPTYDWIDASEGEAFAVGDSGTATLASPFPVNLYGTATTDLVAHADGYLNLGTTSSGTPTFPSTVPLLVQPINVDLVGTVRTRTVGAAPHRRFAVSWDTTKWRTAEPQRHQVVFFEDSTDVLVQYQDASAARATGGLPVGINRGDGQSRLQYAATDDGLTDGLAVLYTTDSTLALTPPAQLRTDGAPVSLGNGVVNPSETPHSVRHDLSVELPAGISPAEVHLQRRDGETWSDVPLVADGDRYRADLIATTTPLHPGGDLTVPLRLAVDEDAALGDLVITSSLRRYDDDTELGVLARTTRTVALTATAPDAPTVTAEPGDGEVTVSWSPGSSGGRHVTEWRVSRLDGGDAIVVPAEQHAATVTGLVNGDAYQFEVVGVNSIGTSQAGRSEQVTPYGLPGAPTGAQGTAGDGQATVSWQAPSSDGGNPIDQYEVTASPGGATAVVDGDTLEATITGLANGTAHTFTVRARNGAGYGPASAASAAVTPRTSPGSPTGVAAVAGNGQATVSWTAPASDGGSAVDAYEVEASPGGAKVQVGADSTTATVAGLANGTAYTFVVRARNDAGFGADSVPSSAVTPAGEPGRPAKPTVRSGDRRAVVSWTAAAANGSPVTGYTVTASPGGATVTVDGTSTSATVSGLSNGTAYTFTVVASNAVGSSPASPTSDAVVPAAPPAGRTVVTASFKPAKVARGRKATLYGSVTGPTAGTVTVQVKSGAAWRSAGKAAIRKQKLPDGRVRVGYVFSVKGKKPGTAVYRVVVSGSASWSAATSRTVKLKVLR